MLLKVSKMYKYFRVYEWMSELSLTQTQLIVFALINNFDETKRGSFNASKKYIAKYCCITERTVHNALRALEEKKLISKRYLKEDYGTKVQYFVDKDQVNKFKKIAKEKELNKDEKLSYIDEIDSIKREKNSKKHEEISEEIKRKIKEKYKTTNYR